MQFIKKNRFLLFLIFLFLGIAYPQFTQNPRALDFISTLNFTLILLSGLYAFSDQSGFLRVSAVFFLLAIVIEWLEYFIMSPLLDGLQPLVTSIVLIMLMVMTLRSIYKATIVDHNVIFNVVAGYIMIGFVGGLLALTIAESYEHAFNVEGIIKFPDAMYFSFVTMTTLGYGDITPAIQATRSLSILLSIVGPMYVAIIVALMVGKFASRNNA